MNCPSQDTLSDLLDDSVTSFIAWRLRRHLKQCSNCAARFQQEERLREQVRSAGATASAPVVLRQKVAARLARQSVPRKNKNSRLYARFAVGSIACACLAIAAYCLPVVSRFFAPRPSYAEVGIAMRQVQTARWTERYLVYSTYYARPLRYEYRYVARLAPPLLITYGSKGFSEVQTETHHVKILENRATYPNFWKDQLREQILRHLVPPAPKARGFGSWQCKPVTVDGQHLLCYAVATGKLPLEGKLTQPGFRNTQWVNPATLRVVRSLLEDYDGHTYTRIYGEQYEYNVSLPTIPEVNKKEATQKR